MAVAPTGAIYKAMTIDGESSRTYGVYITGEAVYNAPQREVEMISIPGRNGQLAIDRGRFENLEVTYPAGIYADTEEDFAEAVSNFRNFLCSRDGYVRIEDDYNPDEYRMGIYKSGLEVETAGHKAGEFEIIFDCKPQRWLNSGEASITVASGDVVTNPTLFESSPLLEVEGYGNIGFNGYEIGIENVLLGKILVSNGGKLPFKPSYTNVNSGDTIQAEKITVVVSCYTDDYVRITNIQKDSWGTSGTGTATFALGIVPDFPFAVDISFYITPASAPYRTNQSIYYGWVNFTVTAEDSTGQTATGSYTLSVRLYIESDGNFARPRGGSELVLRHTSGVDVLESSADFVSGVVGNTYAYSTKSALGHPTYIDTDTGEAYKVDSDEYVSLNNAIDLGSDLPKLSTGANTFEVDGSITSLKIRPRWWKV